MSYHFTLDIIRVECVNEELMEWGKDEMHLLGFAVTSAAQVFSTGYRALGSYATGNTKPPGPLPQTLFEGDLADDALEVLFYGWLIEEDGGGVREAVARLEQEFRASFEEKAASLTAVNFPAVAIPFMAFYKALLPLESSLRGAATSGRDDEVHYAFDLRLPFSIGRSGRAVGDARADTAPLEAPGRVSDDLSLELSQDAGGRRLRAGGPLHSREMPPFDAVLLIAFGGPQGPDDIRPFLANVLRGRSVPPARVEEVAHHYELFGGVSPITAFTRRQADGLRHRLAEAGSRCRCTSACATGTPFLADTMARCRAGGRTSCDRRDDGRAGKLFELRAIP